MLLQLCIVALATFALNARSEVVIEPLRTSNVCADGSQARLEYIANPASSIWVVHLPGGAFCRNLNECSEKLATGGERFTVSPLAAEDIVYHDYMSSDATLNPSLHSANRALLPYCSQDILAGAQPWNDTRTFPRTTGFFNIVQSLQQLFDAFPAPTRVLFSGTSSGGMGMVAHLEALLATSVVQPGGLLANAEILLLLDSSVFFNHRGTMATMYEADPLADFFHVPIVGTNYTMAVTVNERSAVKPWQEEYFAAFALLCQEVDPELQVPCCLTGCPLQKVRLDSTLCASCPSANDDLHSCLLEMSLH